MGKGAPWGMVLVANSDLGCLPRPIPQLQRSINLVTELWPPRFVTMQWLCSQLCCVTAANQWTVVGIKLLATVGWKWGCQPFSCRCSQKWLTAQKRFVPHVCPRNPCLLILLWNLSLHSLQKLEFPKAAVRSPALHYVMVASCPSLRRSCRTKISHVTTAS